MRSTNLLSIFCWYSIQTAVISNPIIHVVCMPGLHVTLGIFDRLFELLEEACYQLDVELAKRDTQPDTLHSFKLYSTAKQFQGTSRRKAEGRRGGSSRRAEHFSCCERG